MEEEGWAAAQQGAQPVPVDGDRGHKQRRGEQPVKAGRRDGQGGVVVLA